MDREGPANRVPSEELLRRLEATHAALERDDVGGIEAFRPIADCLDRGIPDAWVPGWRARRHRYLETEVTGDGFLVHRLRTSMFIVRKDLPEARLIEATGTLHTLDDDGGDSSLYVSFLVRSDFTKLYKLCVAFRGRVKHRAISGFPVDFAEWKFVHRLSLEPFGG